MTISAAGLGCMGLSHAFGTPLAKEEAAEKVRAAFDMGYTFYDTAECYTGTNPDGTTAYNEEAVGEGLKGTSQTRQLGWAGAHALRVEKRV